MNLKSNKGFSLVDSTVAMVVLLIFIPVLGGIIYSIQKTDNSIKRKTTALDIATDIIEIAKKTGYDKVVLTDSQEITGELVDRILEEYNNPTISTDALNNKITFNTTDSKETVYKINIELERYIDTQEFEDKHPEIEEEDKKDVVKTLTVEVEYPVGKNTKKIDISYVLKKF